MIFEFVPGEFVWSRSFARWVYNVSEFVTGRFVLSWDVCHMNL